MEGRLEHLRRRIRFSRGPLLKRTFWINVLQICWIWARMEAFIDNERRGIDVNLIINNVD